MRPEGFRGVFRDDDLARAVYSEGAGIARELPQAVAVPADADDVASLLRWAAAGRRPLIPRGSGSGMAGGAVPKFKSDFDPARSRWIGPFAQLGGAILVEIKTEQGLTGYGMGGGGAATAATGA